MKKMLSDEEKIQDMALSKNQVIESMPKEEVKEIQYYKQLYNLIHEYPSEDLNDLELSAIMDRIIKIIRKKTNVSIHEIAYICILISLLNYLFIMQIGIETPKTIFLLALFFAGFLIISIDIIKNYLFIMIKINQI